MRNPMQTAILTGSLLAIGLVPATAQTCRDDVLASAPDSRYRDNGDATVTDTATGLTWKHCPEGLSGASCESGSATFFTWRSALQDASNVVFADASDWRLPNKNELLSLVEQRCFAPAINSRFFPNTPAAVFWSSSPFASDSDDAWVVSFDDHGGGVYYYAKGNAYVVRLVRGGQ